MTEQVETILQVTKEIISSRKQLLEQVEASKLQIEVGNAQLKKFDTLISILQVVVETPAVLTAATQQEAANATVSPTGSPAAANEAASGIATETAQAAG